VYPFHDELARKHCSEDPAFMGKMQDFFSNCLGKKQNCIWKNNRNSQISGVFGATALLHEKNIRG